jgi:hypothetical protein
LLHLSPSNGQVKVLSKHAILKSWRGTAAREHIFAPSDDLRSVQSPITSQSGWAIVVAASMQQRWPIQLAAAPFRHGQGTHQRRTVHQRLQMRRARRPVGGGGH